VRATCALDVRWGGVLGLFGGLVTIPAPVIGGLIWRGLGSMYVLLLPLVVDLFLRISLLMTIPETLGAAQSSSERDRQGGGARAR
jgi:hypothetical protein